MTETLPEIAGHLPDGETFLTAAALSLGIIATRALPFLLFREKEKIPPVVLYLGGVLPHASMTMLLVYCLKDVSFAAGSHGLPEAIALLFTGAVYWKWKNLLLGVGGGTAFYMFLVQKVFV